MIKSANVRRIKWELTPVSLTGILRHLCNFIYEKHCFNFLFKDYFVKCIVISI